MSQRPAHPLFLLSTVCLTLITLWGCELAPEETPIPEDTSADVTLECTDADHITSYPDVDADGYGDDSRSLTACAVPEGYVVVGNDCDDATASAYPGAPDRAGDGRDQSCDRVDGLAPSVGLPTSHFTSLQEALDAAQNGQTVWVGPGTYAEYALTFRGKAVKLISTQGEAKTVIDAQGQGTVFILRDGEGSSTVLKGFTLTGGEADHQCPLPDDCSYYGGGMYLLNSSPTLSRLTLSDNSAPYGFGGGMSLHSSNPVLTHVTFFGNQADEGGGGMNLDASSPRLTNVTFSGNTTSGSGGGLYLYRSDAQFTRVTLTGNSAMEGIFGGGGGMYIHTSSPRLTRVTFADNTSARDGGGMFLYGANPTLTNVTFTGNSAENSYSGGGGMFLYSSSSVLTNVTFTGNRATGSSGAGGAMYLYDSNPVLTHVTLTGNRSSGTNGRGGGMYVEESNPALSNTIVAYNMASTGGNLAHYAYALSTFNASYFVLYNPPGYAPDTFTPPAPYLAVEPSFLDYADTTTGASCVAGSSLTCLPSDLHLSLTSPLVNAGNPALYDPDGSRLDIGSYGGSDGDGWDVDRDGVYDYFWPGEWADAPSGFDPAEFDCDDLDADVQGCG